MTLWSSAPLSCCYDKTIYIRITNNMKLKRKFSHLFFSALPSATQIPSLSAMRVWRLRPRLQSIRRGDDGATRDLASDEELTTDYRTICDTVRQIHVPF